MSRGATDGIFDECNQGAYITGVEAHSFVSNKIFDNEQIALSTREVNEANVSFSTARAKKIDRLQVSSNISKTYQGIPSCYTSLERAINYEHFGI